MHELKRKIITEIQEIIYLIRIQNYHEGSLLFGRILSEMQGEKDIIEAFSGKDSFLQQVLRQMLEALEKDDMILLADLLEETLLPEIKQMIAAAVMEPVVKGDYCVEQTSSGYATIRHIPSGKYLHSNVNPMEEAGCWLKNCYEPDKERYAVWGCGLGYHIAKLFEIANGSIEIDVYDEDVALFELAEEYGVIMELPREKVHFIADADGVNFLKKLTLKDTGMLLHLPSVRKIQDKKMSDRLQQLFLAWNSTIQLKRMLAINFRYNHQKCENVVDESEKNFAGSEVVLVGGGPSVDSRMDYLQKVQGHKLILAASTALKKLLRAGICVDYVFVMDAQKRTLGHIEGIEDAQVPMVIDSTAYWEFAEKYKGPKYIAYQKDYDAAEEKAQQGGYKTYETGGSVITLMLEVSLMLGAREVNFIGVDLAYPEGVSHAAGTMDRTVRDVSGMEPVPDVNGSMVYTDRVFLNYKRWIETKIKQYTNVKFYNLSDCGAQICGAKILK